MGDAARGDAAGTRAPRCDPARAIQANDGHLVKTTGDGAHAAFAIAANAIAACLAAQRALKAHAWGELCIKSRMALHSGAAEQRDGDYYGPAVNRAARLMAAAHGGQILLSLATEELVRGHLAADIELRDMGERRLKDLVRPERVYQVIAPDLPADFPPLKTLDARPNNLPAQTTPFIGREHAIRAIKEYLSNANVRLLTLSGVGGTGKTRLALQAAADMVDEFEHGVFFVPLAALSDPALVLPTIARAFAVRETAGRPLQEQLQDYLRDKQMLLVLDNFEQVIDAAPLVTDLLTAAPRLKVLVTSREVLRLSGETDYPVPPLSLPDPKRLPPLERSHAVRGGGVVHRARLGGEARLHGHERECPCRRGDLPPARRLAAGDRTGRGARARVAAAKNAGGAEPSPELSHGRCARPAGAAEDAARRDRLEP